MLRRIFSTGMMIMGIAMLSACTQPVNPLPMPSSSSSSATSSSQRQACTTEAMQCPDGSYVGRTGPNCAFAPCPVSSKPSTAKGFLQGTMTIGPICPVERVGHPCMPTPAMYAAHIVTVYSADKATIITTMTPDAQGGFSAMLPAGTYVVDVEHQAVGAVRGVPTTINVHSGQTVSLSIDIDTGIR